MNAETPAIYYPDEEPARLVANALLCGRAIDRRLRARMILWRFPE